MEEKTVEEIFEVVKQVCDVAGRTVLVLTSYHGSDHFATIRIWSAVKREKVHQLVRIFGNAVKGRNETSTYVVFNIASNVDFRVYTETPVECKIVYDEVWVEPVPAVEGHYATKARMVCGNEGVEQ